MNIGKSLKMAMLQNDCDHKILSKLMELSEPQTRALASKPHASCKNIEKLAKAFDMKASEFIALGETK